MRKTASLAAATLCAMLCAAPGTGAAAAQPEQSLIRALSLDAATGQRLAPSATAIKAFIAGGYVPRKPDLRFDYTDYRALRKEARLFGFTILVLEEEYMAKYVGCCVSPGLGVMLSGAGDLAMLTAFAAANGCSVEAPADASDLPADLKIPAHAGQLTSLSCRERDAAR